jgi:hypothetical protein
MSENPRPNSLSQVIVLSVLHDGLTPSQAAMRFGMSRRQIHRFLARSRAIPELSPPSFERRSLGCVAIYLGKV